MKRLGILALIIVFGTQVFASQEVTLNNVQKETYKLTPQKQKVSGSLLINDYKVMDELVKLQKEKDLEAKSKQNANTKSTSINVGGGTNKALEEYKNYVEQYKQATREYEATLKARNYVEKTLGIKTTDEDYQTALNVYKEYFE